MDNDRVIYKNNDTISENVRHSESDIHVNAEFREKIATITDDKQSDYIGETMEYVESYAAVVTNSPNELSKGNNSTMMETKEGLDGAKAASLRNEVSEANGVATEEKNWLDRTEICKNNCTLSDTVRQSDSGVRENVESTEKIATITDDKQSGDVAETMEFVDSIATVVANSPNELLKGNNGTTEMKEGLDDAKAASLRNEISEANGDATEKKNGLDRTETASLPNLIRRRAESSGTELRTSSPPSSTQFRDITQETTRDDENNLEEIERGKAATSLSIIAMAYDNSDSESEQTDSSPNVDEKLENLSDEMEIQITKEYRSVRVTSDEESDSSSGDDSSDSSSDEESDDSDDSENGSKKSVGTKNKNEKNNSRYKAFQEKESKSEFDDLPPIEELKISVPEVLCDPLGEVAWMVEQMVVVRPKPGKPTLNLDTILFVERGRRVLGRVFDVFGQVQDPHYCVRFNSTEHIKESDIKVGMIVYFCPNTEYTSVVFVQDLLKMKVTDELGEDEHPEFSDDEEERAYYATLKQKQKSDKAKTTDEVPEKRQRTDPGWKSNHPWSSGRKQEQSKKPQSNKSAQGWPGDAQRNARNEANLWQQYPPPGYSNVSWPPGSESHRGNAWPPPMCPSQNQYGYTETFGNQPSPGNNRNFFRPPHSFQSGPVPYMQNGPYSQQSNPRRYPNTNFPWQSSVPRQPGAPWRFPPPPPPPPPPGM